MKKKATGFAKKASIFKKISIRFFGNDLATDQNPPAQSCSPVGNAALKAKNGKNAKIGTIRKKQKTENAGIPR